MAYDVSAVAYDVSILAYDVSFAAYEVGTVAYDVSTVAGAVWLTVSSANVSIYNNSTSIVTEITVTLLQLRFKDLFTIPLEIIYTGRAEGSIHNWNEVLQLLSFTWCPLTP